MPQATSPTTRTNATLRLRNDRRADIGTTSRDVDVTMSPYHAPSREESQVAPIPTPLSPLGRGGLAHGVAPKTTFAVSPALTPTTRYCSTSLPPSFHLARML